MQELFWKDVYAKRGGTYKYKIAQMSDKPGNLQSMPYGPVISNRVQMSHIDKPGDPLRVDLAGQMIET